jgi:hypothetical protein
MKWLKRKVEEIHDWLWYVIHFEPRVLLLFALAGLLLFYIIYMIVVVII